VEIKDLPENTIITPKPEEVERLQKERFDKTMVDLENFNSMLEDCR
jgi:NAD(P)H-hydrate repair Nnr-like enzyme with NAD(P)H-hydrate dehydratase domain